MTSNYFKNIKITSEQFWENFPPTSPESDESTDKIISEAVTEKKH